jgi:hypothetical protein
MPTARAINAIVPVPPLIGAGRRDSDPLPQFPDANDNGAEPDACPVSLPKVWDANVWIVFRQQEDL